MRQTERRTEQNKSVKGVVKSTVRKTREAAESGDAKAAKEWYQKAQQAIDKAAQKKVLKKNTAARKKSRLNALVKKATSK